MRVEGGCRTLSLQPKRELKSPTVGIALTHDLAFARAALPIARRHSLKNKTSIKRRSAFSSWLGLHGRSKQNLFTAMPAGTHRTAETALDDGRSGEKTR